MPRVDWKMTGSDKVVQGIRKQNQATKEGNTLLKANAKEAAALDKASVRLARSNETAQETYKRKLLEATKALRGVKGGTETLRRETARLKEELRKAGKAGKGLASGMSGIKSALGIAGILGAVNRINAAYQVWITNTREISAESIKSQNDIIAFAALQEGGTKGEAVKRATALAAQYGVTNRGEAFNTVQALQSAPGSSLNQGIEAARVVFAASQLGVSVAAGTELETLGASQGQAPGMAIRRAFIAGQQSSRTPEVIAKAAAGLAAFEDKDFGFAVTSVLAGSAPADRLQVLTERAGTALSSVGSAQGSFEKLGLGDATQKERLSKLAELGINTQEELKGFGFTEIRAIKALSTLVSNLPRVEEVEKIIKRDAVPGLLAQERIAIEAEIPGASGKRRIDVLQTRFKDELAFGPSSQAALKTDEQQRIRGLANQRAGLSSVMGIDTIDSEGRTDTFQQIMIGLFGDWFDINKSRVEQEKIKANLDATNPEKLEAIADSSRRTAEATESSSQRQAPVTVRQE